MSQGPRAILPSINGWNAEYLEAEYRRFQSDPGSVSPDLASFFHGFDLASATALPGSASPGRPALSAADDSTARFQSAVDNLIEAYRQSGHMAARLDPFGRPRPRPPELALTYHGLSDADLTRTVHTGDVSLPDSSTLGTVIQMLEETYCGSIAFEVMHVESEEERRWLLDRIEKTRGRIPSKSRRRRSCRWQTQ